MVYKMQFSLNYITKYCVVFNNKTNSSLITCVVGLWLVTIQNFRQHYDTKAHLKRTRW